MAHGIEVTATSDLKSATSQSSEFPQQVLYSHSRSFALRMAQHTIATTLMLSVATLHPGCPY